MTRVSGLLPTLATAVQGLAESWRKELERSELLTSAWTGESPSHVEAACLLRSVGPQLQAMSQVPHPGQDPDLEFQLARLCAYYKSRDRSSSWQLFALLPRLLLTAALPWRASYSILQAELTPLPASHSRTSRDVNGFGHFLSDHAYDLSSGSADDLHRLKDTGQLGDVQDERLIDSCADTPVDPCESIARLHTLIDNAATSPRVLNRYAIGLAISGVSLIAILFGSWDGLGLRQHLQGVKSLLVPMCSALVASAAMCAAIREELTNHLNAYALAKSKTLNKCCAAVLALSTLLLARGFHAGSRDTGSESAKVPAL